ncbi:hypothetical protein ACTXT7_012065 [Hymenolepis weldensis]
MDTCSFCFPKCNSLPYLHHPEYDDQITSHIILLRTEILFVLCSAFELKCPDGVLACQARKHRFSAVVNTDQQSDQIRIIRGFIMSMRFFNPALLFNSLNTTQLSDEVIILTLILPSSYGESDSVISSCMLTSESFYGQTESSLLRSDNEFYSVDNVKISREVLSHAKPDKTPVNESPPSKSRKRNVNWGDRKSIRLSIEYPKSMAADFNPKTLEKVNNSSYFRICFGTEFSDEDDEDALFTSGGQSMTGESDSTLDVHEKDFGNSIIPSSSNTKIHKDELLTGSKFKIFLKDNVICATPLQNREKAKKPLLGVIETEDGMLSPQSLAKFSLPQIQLIINDLLDQISPNSVAASSIAFAVTDSTLTSA